MPCGTRVPAALLLLGLLLTGQIAPLRAETPVDPRAEALLLRVEKKLAALRSFSASSVKLFKRAKQGDKPALDSRDKGIIRVAKPNFAYLTVTSEQRTPAGTWKANAPRPQIIASDGTTSYSLYADNTFHQKPADSRGRRLYLGDSRPIDGFFDAATSPYRQEAELKKSGALTGLQYKGTQNWEGARYDVVVLSQKSDFEGHKYVGTARYYIGDDDLIHRLIVDFSFDDRAMHTEHQLRDIRTNFLFSARDFAYTLPNDARAFEDRSRPARLAVGSRAPDFTVRAADGKPLKLSDFRGKTVVLDFWATWCDPCLKSFPQTLRVAKKTASRGVVVLAVNVLDSKAAFDKWVPDHRDYSAAMVFAIDNSPNGKDVATRLYKVSGIPTQYVIDPQGRVAASIVGYNGSTAALEKAIERAVRAAP